MGATANGIKSGWSCCDTCNNLYMGQTTACVGGTNHACVATGGISVTEGAFSGYQDNWRQCKKCASLFYYGNPTNGVCFKGSVHDLGTSPNYSLKKRSTEASSDHLGKGYEMWRWCHKCESLFFGGNTSKMGRCPSGGSHDASKSAYYSTVFVV